MLNIITQKLSSHHGEVSVIESNRKAMNQNWSNQKAKPKREINKYYK